MPIFSLESSDGSVLFVLYYIVNDIDIYCAISIPIIVLVLRDTATVSSNIIEKDIAIITDINKQSGLYFEPFSILNTLLKM